MTDELTWLRELEQDVQCLRTYTNSTRAVDLYNTGKAVTADNLATSLKVKINARVIELLEEKAAKEQCGVIVNGHWCCVPNQTERILTVIGHSGEHR